MDKPGRYMVSVRDGFGNSRAPWPLEDLTNAQLAWVLDAIVNELVRRDVWAGPRPTALLEELQSVQVNVLAQEGNR